MARDDTLEVYQGDNHVGRLHDADPMRFEYVPAWQEHPEAVSLSPSLPLTQRLHVGDEVLAYFENLLPEGDLRQHLALRHHTTTVFGLLKAIGGDTASGFTLLPLGDSPAPPRYRPSVGRRWRNTYGTGNAAPCSLSRARRPASRWPVLRTSSC